jgi:hypothetical protein
VSSDLLRAWVGRPMDTIMKAAISSRTKRFFNVARTG